MFFATGIILQRVVSFGKSAAWSRNFALGLTAFLVAVAVYHCYAIETLAHQSTFVLMIAWVAHRTRSLIKERVSNKQLKQRMGELAKMGVGTFFTAIAT